MKISTNESLLTVNNAGEKTPTRRKSLVLKTEENPVFKEEIESSKIK